MRKLPLLSVVAVPVFAVGVAAGQIAGIGSSSAAPAPSSSKASVARPAFSRSGPPGIMLGPRAAGSVTAVNGDTITVKANGDRRRNPGNEYSSVTTIVLTSSTKVRSGFGQSSTASSIKVGSFVIAEGALSSDKTTLTASTVMIVPGRGGPGRFGPAGITIGPRADGTVTAMNGDTITVKADGDHGPNPANEDASVTTIVLTSSTKIQSGFGQSSTASSVKVGSFVIAAGTLSSDKTTLTATTLMIAPSGGRGPASSSSGFPRRPYWNQFGGSTNS